MASWLPVRELGDERAFAVDVVGRVEAAHGVGGRDGQLVVDGLSCDSGARGVHRTGYSTGHTTVEIDPATRPRCPTGKV